MKEEQIFCNVCKQSNVFKFVLSEDHFRSLYVECQGCKKRHSLSDTAEYLVKNEILSEGKA